MIDLSKLKRIIDIEYSDIIRDSDIYHDKLRVFIRDGSIVDIWFSKKVPGRFSYHWERRQINGKNIAMTTSLTRGGKESLRFPSIFITAHKIKFGRVK